MNPDTVTATERTYLRELARRCLDYAHLPVMAERRKRWYDHNAGKAGPPMLVMELDTFLQDLLPPLQCTSPLARRIEAELQAQIANHELVDDDKVLPPDYTVPWQIDFRLFDQEIRYHTADDAHGRSLGHAYEHTISDLRRDLESLKPSVFHVDREATRTTAERVASLIGDILPVVVKNQSMTWLFGITARAVMLMGMENLFVSLMDCPDAVARLFNRIADDFLAFCRWMEAEGLLTLNNGNDYVGAGSYGFTHELPASDFAGTVRCRDLWLNVNSQEAVGLSADTFKEYIYPPNARLAREFGRVYYGCCEPVHDVWDGGLKDLPNLRKVSVSAWCDQRFMGDALRGSGVIFSRKPFPNYIGVGDFVPDDYAAHIAETLAAARGCRLEIIHRDIYTLNGDRTRAGRAIAVARRVIEEHWKE